MNLPRLKTKQGEPYSHSFKYILITRITIKPILTSVSFGDIVSTRSSMLKNIRSFMKAEANQFSQLWARQVHNFKKSSLVFTECLQEQNFY